MSWFKERIKPVELIVDASGLARVIQELHWNGWLTEQSRGIDVRVFAQSRGTFIVYLTRDQTKLLLDLLPMGTLQDRYGTSE